LTQAQAFAKNCPGQGVPKTNCQWGQLDLPGLNVDSCGTAGAESAMGCLNLE